jgi:hypothetical protein
MASKKPPAFSWLAHDGAPASPELPAGDDRVLVRYMFDGGKLARDAHLATFIPKAAPVHVGTDGCRTVLVTSEEVLAAIAGDGVEMQGFYATAYEEKESGGAWMRMLPASSAGARPSLTFSLTFPPAATSTAVDDAADGRGKPSTVVQAKGQRKPRIDVKLCKEPIQGRSAALAHYGFFAIGIVGAKTMPNVGSLWRSAFQMGASYIFTVGARYAKTQNTGTESILSALPTFCCRWCWLCVLVLSNLACNLPCSCAVFPCQTYEC